MENPDDVFAVAPKPAKPAKADPDAAERAEAEAIGLTLDELREVKAAQARLWPLGQ